jgi:hypothetical protein
MATDALDTNVLQRRQGLKRVQLTWLWGQAGLLLGVLAWQALAHGELLRLFWTDPLGVRLAIAAMLLAAVNFGALLGGCLFLNRLSTSSSPRSRWLYDVLAILLCTICFIGCYLPVFFILLIGPSAMNINQTLSIP